MKKVNTAYFIASRLASAHASARNKVMVRIAVTGVAVSIAVMIVALAVIFGFREQITSKVAGFNSELQIVNLDNNNSFETVPIRADQPFWEELAEIKGIAGYYRYGQKAGVLRGKEAIQGIVLKGVDSAFDWRFFHDNLIAGAVPDVGQKEKSKDVLLSLRLAKKMQLDTGDRFEIMFIQDRIRRDRFRVSGLYSTSLTEFDDIMVMTDLRNIQRLNNWGDSLISGIGVNLTDEKRMAQVKEAVEDVVFSTEDDGEQPLMVVDMKERNGAIFDWLQLQDVNIAVILTIMLTVASFNMICITLIILLEKSSLIGLLKTLGMRNKTLQQLFLYRISYILVRGLLWGNLIGLGVIGLQHHFGVVKLSEAEYLLSQVPVSLHWEHLVLLNVGSFGIIVLLQVVPTFIVSRISPHTTIKVN